MDSTRRTPPPPRSKVLVTVGHAEAGPYVEVHAADTVDCRIVDVPFTGSTRGEIIAEEVIEAMLPRCYAAVYNPFKPRATHVVRKVTAEHYVDRELHLDLLRGLDQVAQPAEEVAWV